MTSEFRLQSVLDLRRRRRETLEQELAEAQRKVAEVELSLATLRRALDDQRQRVSERQRSGRLDVDAIRRGLTFIDSIEQRIDRDTRLLADLRDRAETIRQSLVNALQDQRAIEKLRDREQERTSRQDQWREQRDTDEISRSAFLNQRKAS